MDKKIKIQIDRDLADWLKSKMKTGDTYSSVLRRIKGGVANGREAL